MSFACMSLVGPKVAIDSVKARRDIESAPAALREIADEARRGNIDMSELSRFVAAVMPVCLRSKATPGVVSELGETWISCDAGAF